MERKDDFFTNLGKKPCPLYACNGWLDGIKWRVPKQMHCPLVETNKPSEIINITLWWEDITLKPIPAYECFKVTTTVTSVQYCLGGYIQYTRNEKVSVTPSQCKAMVNSRKSPDGEDLVRIRNGYYGTKNIPDAQYTWCRDRNATAVNYYLIHLSITVSNIDNSVQATTMLTETCYAFMGFCKTENGMLVWTPIPFDHCRIKAGEATTCLKTGSRISCPEVSLAITEWEIIRMCGFKFGRNYQGIIFTQDSVWTTERKLTTDSGKIKEKLRLEAASREDKTVRFRRETTEAPVRIDGNRTSTTPSPFISGFATTAEMNARFEFLYDMLSHNMSFNVQQLHSEVCKSNKMLLETIRILAQGGSPSLLVRVLLGNDNYRARLNGDVLSIWKCEEIYNYMMLPRTTCIVEWPVMYMDGHDQKTGYISPLSHEIITEPTPVQCPAPDYFFDTGDFVVLLTNKSILTDIPTLPKPLDNFNISEMPNLSFKSPGIYTLSSISGHETILELTREMRNRYVLEDSIRAAINHEVLTNTEKDTLSMFSVFTLNPIKSWFYNLFGGFVSFGIIVAVIVTIFLFRSSIFSCCTSCSDKISQKFENQRLQMKQRRQKRKQRRQKIKRRIRYYSTEEPTSDEMEVIEIIEPEEDPKTIYPTLAVNEGPKKFKARVVRRSRTRRRRRY